MPQPDLPVETWTLLHHAIGGAASPAGAGDQIEVGAAEGELRLWRAREALRQAELSLRSQTEARDNLRSAATSLLGWAVTAIGVVAAASLSAPHPAWQGAAVIAVMSLLTTASICVAALFPDLWARPGYDPAQVLQNTLPSELEILEALARGGSLDMENNRARLIRMDRLMRLAWIAFAVTPVLGLLTLRFWEKGASRLLTPFFGVIGHTNG